MNAKYRHCKTTEKYIFTVRKLIKSIFIHFSVGLIKIN
jgi:hypothetical protein